MMGRFRAPIVLGFALNNRTRRSLLGFVRDAPDWIYVCLALSLYGFVTAVVLASLVLQMRADAFNPFNRTNFGVNGVVGNANFGRATGPQYGPRIITMGLRLYF